MTMTSIIRKSIAPTALAFLCGCGGGSDSGGIGGTGVVSSGVMTKGSVILNGVRFEDMTASILIDDVPKSAANLQSGMVVRVRGNIDGSGRNGTAQQVEAQIEVRGAVASVNASSNPQSFVVLGQTVLIDDLTVLNGITAPISNALNGTLVEVHGLRDSTGEIRATRIEANPGQMADDTVDEIRGVVTNRTGPGDDLFNVGPQLVNANGAVIVPAGASFGNGSVVEVHCTVRPCVNGSGEFVASRIEVEDAEDAGMQPGQGQRFEVEGLISGFTAHPGNFSVAGVPVITSNATRFEGGISADLGNDIKVEAEGVWNGASLVASKIEFKRSVVRLQGVVTASASSTFTLDVAGRLVSVEVDDFTDGAVPPVNATNCVQVRGQRRAGGANVVVAGEIRIGTCSNSDRPVLQAPVEAESGTNLTLLGFPINVGSPTDDPPYEDLDGNPLTQSQFFLAVTPGDPGPPAVAGTLVKVTFDDGGVTVHQVELED